MAISLIGPMPTQDTGNILNQAGPPMAPRPTPVARPAPRPVDPKVRAAVARDQERLRYAPPPGYGPRPGPPPPPPRAFRTVEQERIDAQRLMPAGFDPKKFMGDVGGNILDLATPESRALAMQSHLGKGGKPAPPAPEDPHEFFKLLDPSASPSDTGNIQDQTDTSLFDPEQGGYKFFTKHEAADINARRGANGRYMADIAGRDESGRDGVYVYLAGNTSLSNDGLGISTQEMWSHMAPAERDDYLKARFSMRTLRKDAPQRFDLALRANDIAVSAQHRYLIQERKKGTKPGQLLGGFFDTNKDTMSTRAAVQEWDEIANFLVWQEAMPGGKLGMKSIKSVDEVFNALLHDVQTDRHMAGELVMAMLNAHMIEGAQEKYVKDYVGMDKAGKIIANWNPIDWNDNLRILVQEVARRQENGAQVGTPMDSVWRVIKNSAQHNQDTVAATASDFGSSSGGGGGGGGYRSYGGGGYGGGGGGENNRVFLSDAAMLGTQLDSIARARLGRVATTEEKAAFVAHFHGLETQYSAAYVGGGVATQPDVQGQAVAWIESRNSGEQAGETAGEFITALAQFLRGPGLSTGG